jgi:sugar transferase (PEP-CTERM/EpsH1 system associated)
MPTSSLSWCSTQSIEGIERRDTRPLVLHVVWRFSIGGLENGVVNLINYMPPESYRHAVLSLTEVTDFRDRVQHHDVEFIELKKGPGHCLKLYPQIYRILKRLSPAVIHTNNLAALEVVVPAWAAGVPVRIHSEHGSEGFDLGGTSHRYQWLRRIYRPFVSHYIAVSTDLYTYLLDQVGLPKQRVSRIFNGVDISRFYPSSDGKPGPIEGCPFDPDRHWLVGTVGRMQPVKDQLNLVRAFAHALKLQPILRGRLRLIMVGDGPLRSQSLELLKDFGLDELAWLPGERNDIPTLMRGLHCFVLPSLSEGHSYTILEAMASGLPVIATDVGGNSELVQRGQTGELVPAGDSCALGQAVAWLANASGAAKSMGKAGQAFVEEAFSQHAMVQTYQDLYDRQLRLSRTSA